MRDEARSPWLRYGGALACVALAAGVRLALAPGLGGRQPFATFYVALLASAWFGGLGPSLVALALGALAGLGFLLGAPARPPGLGLADALGVALYLVVGAAIIASGEAQRRVRRRLGREADEHRLAAEAEREQRERLRITLASIGDAVIVADADGRVVLMNAVAEAMTAWPAAEAVGRPVAEVFQIAREGTGEPLLGPVERALREGVAVGLANHTVLLARDGDTRPIDDSAAPILDGRGRVCGAVLVFRDIAGRRRAERALEASEARKAAILESAPDAVITIDGDGHILEFNPAAERMFGRARGDVLGREMSELIVPPPLREAHRRGLARICATGEGTILGRRVEIEAMRADGSEFPVELAVTRIPGDGPALFTALVRDLTERRRADRRRAARLAASEVMAGSATIAEAIPRLLRAVCEGLGWEVGTFWTIDEDSGTLVCREVWHDPARDVSRFASACRELAFTRGVGLPGRVWEGREPAWIFDAPEDGNFPRARAAAESGLRGAFAAPIRADDRILGVIECFSAEPREPDPDLLEVMASVGVQVGQFLERARAVEAVRVEEERLRLAQEAGRMGTWDWDLRTDKVSWSAGLEAIHGLEPGTFPGTFEAYQSDIHPDDRARVLASIAGAVERGGEHHAEYRLVLPDGNRRWVEARGKLFRDGSGAPRRMIGVCMDVTERRQADAERLRLVTLIEQSPDFIAYADADGRPAYLNRAGLRLVGLADLDEARRTALLDYFPEGDRDRVAREILPTVARWGSWSGEVRFRHFRTGEAVPVLWNVFLLPDPETGHPAHLACVARDITGRKRDEEALRESEERFRMMAESIPQLAWMARPDGYIVWYNRRWFEYTGTAPEQMEGWGWQSVHDPDELPRVLEGFKAAIASGERWEDTFPLRRHDGAMRWHLSRALPFRDDGGRVVRWFGTNTDITERREMEAALREADRRKDEFLATLAHELRNPLAPIRNALRLMARADGDRAAVEAERELIERQVLHMTALVDDLMDVSRISRGKIELRRRPMDLASALEQAARSVRPLIEERRHELAISTPTASILVEADPTRLDQVVTNLLTNAAKYTDPGGRIALSAERRGDEAVIRVLDTGIGIGPEMLPRIFDIFTQAERRLDLARGGLGIGLSLVKRLVELHGGSIEARSDGPGLGSEFVVRLPALPASRTDEPPAAPEATAMPSPDGTPPRRRVLVVDDNVDAASSLARLLTRLWGQEVRVAHDGPSALEVADEFRPEVALLDIGLPGLSGYEVAERLRLRPESAPSLLVALTGWGQEADRERSRRAGFDRHLVKPVDPDALLALLVGLEAESPVDGALSIQD